MTRLLPLLAIVALAVPAVAAQVGYYNGLDDGRDASPRGVRVGLGIGPSIYAGPDLLFGEAPFQDDVVATNLAITAEVTAPLSRQVYGRLMGGLLNIGADDTRPDLVSAADNPFLTSSTILAEGDLLFYMTPPRETGLAPYVFSGLSSLFATGNASPGVRRSALAIPVGAGLELGLSRTVSLFAEASYRFGITSVGEEVGSAVAAAVMDDECRPGETEKECKERKDKCAEDPTLPECDGEVGEGSDSDFDRRFNSALILGGIRLGFSRPAPAPIPAPRPLPLPEPIPPPEPDPIPLVCDLVELNAVYFDYGSATLDRRARARLDENVELLLADPACCVFIDAFTDTPEGDRFGIGLAGRRSQAVYDYYLGRGVGASRLQTRNRGVAVPACDKEDPGPGCERNRRVESLPVDCERFQYIIENPSYDPY